MKEQKQTYSQKTFLGLIQNAHELIRKSNIDFHNSKGGFLAEHLYLNDFRTVLFYMEGLARIFRKISKSKDKFEQLYYNIKLLEDTFGNYDFWYVNNNLCKQKKLPEKIQQYTNEKKIMSLGVLEYVLLKENWIENITEKESISPRCESLIEIIKNLNWQKNSEKENNKLLAFLRDESIKTDLKIRSGDINLNELENGIHEIRRRLRWFPIYRIALGGKMQYSNVKSNDSLYKFITKEESAYGGENPFNKSIKTPTGVPSIKIHKGAYMGISYLVREIGIIKDKALFHDMIQEACVKTGTSFKKIQPGIKLLCLTHKEATKAAEKLISDFILKENGLQYMASHFDSQIKA